MSSLARDPALRSGSSAELVTVGFMPLVDCAPLVVARQKGFARDEGLDLALVREISWANIRDRVSLGYFDAAHMPGPLPIACTLGVGRPAVPMVAPVALGLGGNAITLAADLFAAMREMAEDAGSFARFEPLAVGRALAAELVRRRQAGREPPAFAVVHPFSSHNYDLRYWLAAAGLDPDADVRLTVLPPPATVDGLRDRQIEGFCAGEPWNSLAVDAGAGVLAVAKSDLWRQGPEKVLGLRADFADRHPDRVAALVRATVRAADWCGRPENGGELAALLADPAHVGAPAAVIARAIDGRLVRAIREPAGPMPDFLVFGRGAATFPWTSHAAWFYAQMVRWGHVAHDARNAEAAQRTYRPDLYRAALAGTATDLPRASAKVEGALRSPTPVASRFGTLVLGPDGFFDGRLFDPDHLDRYIASFATEPGGSARGA